MLPATTAWLPNFFTPRRLLSQSRPLRVEPPVFLCAMSQYSYQGIGADESGLDTGDFDLSEPLTVALTLHVVLTTAELDDAHFVVTTLRNDFGNHFSAVYDRSADLNVVT